MIDDDAKIRLQALTEIHKQNYDFIRAVIIGLSAVISSFLIASIGLISLKVNDSTASTNAGCTIMHALDWHKIIPYLMFTAILFLSYLLNEATWRSGHQKFVEEELNTLLGADLFVWATRIDGRLRWPPSAAMGFVTGMMTVLCISIYSAVPPINKLLWSDAPDCIAYVVLATFLVFSCRSIFSVSRKSYNLARHDSVYDLEAVRQRAYLNWQNSGSPSGSQKSDWDLAKKQLETESYFWIFPRFWRR